ncbi:MAG: F0F1 ATP synthase subunit B [Pseudomonadota bacterium]
MRTALTATIFLTFTAAPAVAATGLETFSDPVKGLALLALIIFFAICWRAGAFRLIGNALDERGKTIEAQIEEARSLREEAAKMLADAERKQKAAEDDAKAILEQARTDAKTMMETARGDLKQRLVRREALAEARIARAEAEAAADVRKAAADAATQAARTLLSGDAATDQFDAAADTIEKALN